MLPICSLEATSLNATARKQLKSLAVTRCSEYTIPCPEPGAQFSSRQGVTGAENPSETYPSSYPNWISV